MRKKVFFILPLAIVVQLAVGQSGGGEAENYEEMKATVETKITQTTTSSGTVHKTTITTTIDCLGTGDVVCEPGTTVETFEVIT